MSKWVYSILYRFCSLIISLGCSIIIAELFFITFAYLFKLFNFSFLEMKRNKKRIDILKTKESK